MYFARNLKYLMEEHNKTKYRLSKDLHVSQTTVANWINGSTDPFPRIKNDIAACFRITIEELTGEELPPIRELDEDQQKKPNLGDEVELNEAEENLIILFRQIPEEKQLSVLESLELALRMQGLL